MFAQHAHIFSKLLKHQSSQTWTQGPKIFGFWSQRPDSLGPPLPTVPALFFNPTPRYMLLCITMSCYYYESLLLPKCSHMFPPYLRAPLYSGVQPSNTNTTNINKYRSLDSELSHVLEQRPCSTQIATKCRIAPGNYASMKPNRSAESW